MGFFSFWSSSREPRAEDSGLSSQSSPASSSSPSSTSPSFLGSSLDASSTPQTLFTSSSSQNASAATVTRPSVNSTNSSITSPTSLSTSNASPSSATTRPSSSKGHDFASRDRSPLPLLLGGGVFTMLSMIMTRRAIMRKRIALYPTYYHPSNAPPQIPVVGALEAVHALGIATLNVASIGLLLTGGLLWAFNVRSPQDLRRRLRRSMGFDAIGDGNGNGNGDDALNPAEAATSEEATNARAEAELQEWVAQVLQRRDEKAARKAAAFKSGSS